MDELKKVLFSIKLFTKFLDYQVLVNPNIVFGGRIILQEQADGCTTLAVATVTGSPLSRQISDEIHLNNRIGEYLQVKTDKLEVSSKNYVLLAYLNAVTSRIVNCQ